MAKSITDRSEDEPKPEAKKRNGGTDSSAPAVACILHADQPAARGRYAALAASSTKVGKVAGKFTRAADEAAYSLDDDWMFENSFNLFDLSQPHCWDQGWDEFAFDGFDDIKQPCDSFSPGLG